MKQLLLVAILIAFTTAGFTQSKGSTFLVVRFEASTYYADYRSYRYFSISAEAGNPYAAAIYNLVEVNPEVEAAGKASFFYGEIDSTKSYFNYFKTHTAGMEYLAKRGWQLVTVISEVFTDGYRTESAGGRDYPVPVVRSDRVYYFKKELQ